LFTGIIEEKGKVSRLVKRTPHAFQLIVDANEIIQDMAIGDSIAINGVCLTVTSFQSDHFSVDVMPETVHATNLLHMTPGTDVNLERAMKATGRFGGHFVSGHVDGTGKILSRQPKENAIVYKIEMPADTSKYVIPRGSVSVDGISLTIFARFPNAFTISVIPHTAAATTLGGKTKGDTVNIECDMLAKHVHHLLHQDKSEPQTNELDRDTLSDAGFMQGGW